MKHVRGGINFYIIASFNQKKSQIAVNSFYMKSNYKSFNIFLYYIPTKIPLDTTYLPTQKYKIPYHATNVIFPYHHPTFFFMINVHKSGDSYCIVFTFSSYHFAK